MTTLREGAMRQALEVMQSVNHANYSWACVEAITALKAALAEEAMQRLTDVQQEIEAALAEPAQEPVAWGLWMPLEDAPRLLHITKEASEAAAQRWAEAYNGCVHVPLYTAPPQRKPRHISYVCPQCHWSLDERKPLTDEEIRDLWSWAMTADAERTATTQQHAFARAIERSHGIGGSNG